MSVSNFNQFINKVCFDIGLMLATEFDDTIVTNIIIVNIDKLISDLSKTSLLYRYLPERQSGADVKIPPWQRSNMSDIETAAPETLFG